MIPHTPNGVFYALISGLFLLLCGSFFFGSVSGTMNYERKNAHVQLISSLLSIIFGIGLIMAAFIIQAELHVPSPPAVAKPHDPVHRTT